jgi:ribulose-5-phosphate 4-epimerase/fuculose-1-phosphate aldolase
MACGAKDCGSRGSCHTRCPEGRFVAGVPVVSGEVGTGPTGLCNTLPGALAGRRAAIVYGHGLFTLAWNDFGEALETMIEVERACRCEFFERIDAASPAGV